MRRKEEDLGGMVMSLGDRIRKEKIESAQGGDMLAIMIDITRGKDVEIALREKVHQEKALIGNKRKLNPNLKPLRKGKQSLN
jgi:hypothetical protein